MGETRERGADGGPEAGSRCRGACFLVGNPRTVAGDVCRAGLAKSCCVDGSTRRNTEGAAISRDRNECVFGIRGTFLSRGSSCCPRAAIRPSLAISGEG